MKPVKEVGLSELLPQLMVTLHRHGVESAVQWIDRNLAPDQAPNLLQFITLEIGRISERDPEFSGRLANLAESIAARVIPSSSRGRPPHLDLLLANCRTAVGMYLAEAGFVSSALRRLRAAAIQFSRLGLRSQTAMTFLALSSVHLRTANLQAARLSIENACSLTTDSDTQLQGSLQMAALLRMEGRLHEAHDLLDKLSSQEQLPDIRQIEIASCKAQTIAELGRVQEALVTHDDCRERALTLEEYRWVGLEIFNMAQCHVRLGLFEEATELLLEAGQYLEEFGSRRELIELDLWHGYVFSGQAQVTQDAAMRARALEFLYKARTEFDRVSDYFMCANVDFAIASVLDEMDDPAHCRDALEVYSTLRSYFDSRNMDSYKVLVQLGIGGVYNRLRRFRVALNHLQPLLASEDLTALPNLAYRLYFEIGKAMVACKQRREGLCFLERASKTLEEIRTDVQYESLRQGVAGSAHRVYEALVTTCTQLGEHEQAFLYSESARSRTLVDLLASRAECVSRRLPEGLRREFSALSDLVREAYARLQAACSGGESSTVRRDLRAALQNVTSRKMRLARDLWHHDAETASLLHVEQSSHAAVGDDWEALIPDDVAVIEYFPMQGGDVLVFVLTNRGIEKSRRIVQADATNLRQLCHSCFRQASGLLVDPTSALVRAYDLLIRPLERTLRNRRLVYIVPGGWLHSLPFHALIREAPSGASRQYMIERHSVAYAPSWEVLKHCRNKLHSPSAGGCSISFCDDRDGDPSLFLPFASLESGEVAALLNGRQYSGDQATRVNLARIFDQWDLQSSPPILHFSCHGVFNKHQPMASSILLRDGPMDAYDVFALPAAPGLRLVFLSACDLGRDVVGRGDEAFGLIRAILYVGAPRIISSLWRVVDIAGVLLSIWFYRYLQEGHTCADALAKVQCRMLRQDDRLWDAIPRKKLRKARARGSQLWGESPGHAPEKLHELVMKAPFFWAAYRMTGWDGPVAASYQASPDVTSRYRKILTPPA